MKITIKDYKLPHTGKAINMTIPEGLVYISGNNGTGKTLLLDSIAGLNRVGKSQITGTKDIIYINQSTYFSDKLKVKTLLEFTYFLDGGAKNKQDFLHFIAKNLGPLQVDVVADILDKRWGVLSGGERKFIYALIILSIPKEWYIMDEPFAYVDNEKKKLLIEIIKMKLKERKSIIITTHEYFEELEVLNPHKMKLE